MLKVINFMLRWCEVKRFILPIISLMIAIESFFLWLYAEENEIIWLSLLLGSLISIPIEVFWKSLLNLFKRKELFQIIQAI